MPKGVGDKAEPTHPTALTLTVHSAPKENVQKGDAEPHGQDTQGLNELMLNKCQSGSGAALRHFAFSLNI